MTSQAAGISAPTQEISTSSSETTGTLLNVNTSVAPAPKKSSTQNLLSRTGLVVDLSRTTSLQREGDVSRVAENSLLLSPSFKLNDSLKLAALGILTQEETGERNTTFSNLQLGLSYKAIPFNENLSVTPVVTAFLPTDTVNNKNDKFQGGLGVSGRFSIDPKWKYPMTALYTLGVAKNVHEYTLNAFGSPNIEYKMANALTLNLPIAYGFSADLTGAYTSAWTYRGYVHTRFDLIERITYEATAKWSMYVSHSNGGSAVKANGRDSNIDLYDENTSVISAGTSYVF